MAPQKQKPRGLPGTSAASKINSNAEFSKIRDPLSAWFALAKPSRSRRTKRGWQRGYIDAFLTVNVVLLMVLVMLAIGGLA